MDQSTFETLTVRCLSGEATADEKQLVSKAVETSDQFREQYEALKTIWHSTERDLPKTDVDRAWVEMTERLSFQKNTTETQDEIKKTSAWPWWAAAACLIIMIGSFWMNQRSDTLVTGTEIVEQTRHAERRTIFLPDASEVRLNVGTSIMYQADFSDSVRLVKLNGEAFFNVNPDGRPFIVRTPTTTVRVLGTSFNVRSRGNTTTVIVAEGRVSVSDTSVMTDAVILTSDQQILHRPGLKAIIPQRVDADDALGWLHGKLVFNSVSVQHVMDELTRVYDAGIIIEDEQIMSRTITATFDESSLDIVMKAICLAARADFRFDNNTYHIIPRDE